MSPCLACQSDRTETLLNFGPQPVSSHFTKSPDTHVVQHDLGLVLCNVCAVVQLAQPFPFTDLVPPYEWMTYREPEAHLDAVVEQIWHLPGISENSAVGGITFKDATTLERMRARGCSRIWSLDLHGDLGVSNPSANIESVQALLTPAKALEIVARRGPVDML